MLKNYMMKGNVTTVMISILRKIFGKKKTNKSQLEFQAYMAESALRNTLTERIACLTKELEDIQESMNNLIEITLYLVESYEKFLRIAKEGGPHVQYLAAAQLPVITDALKAVYETIDSETQRNKGEDDGE